MATAFISGCAYIEKTPMLQAEAPTEENLRHANANPQKIVRLFQSEFVALDTVPVGSILPLYRAKNFSLPENWRYCNGDVVNDPKSPFNGAVLPKLIGGEFLTSTLDGHGQTGGSNKVEMDSGHLHSAITRSSGTHSHGEFTGTESTNAPQSKITPGDVQIRLVEQGHKHAIRPDGTHSHEVVISTDGSHDHGGDKRPKWFGVLYIIKIK